VLLSIKEEQIDYEGGKVRLSVLELENAILVFFNRDKFRLGTVAIALPMEKTVTSSILLGGKYLLSSRAIAERAAAIYGKMVLASVSVELSEAETIRLASSLLERLASRNSQ
jgi:hypothetical protein